MRTGANKREGVCVCVSVIEREREVCMCISNTQKEYNNIAQSSIGGVSKAQLLLGNGVQGTNIVKPIA